MENITRESIVQAIQKIDQNPNLRNGRESSTYDLVYEREKYPPILVLSEANKIRGGEELYLESFNNSVKAAFKPLENNGFNIIPKINLNVADNYKDKIHKNRKMLTKDSLTDAVELCKIFDKGQKDGTITKETYSKNFSSTHLEQFKQKYKNTPNKLIQEELKAFYDKEIKHIDSKLHIRNFGFWGNNIYSYVWTCIYYDFNKDSLPASYSPQLYILVNKMGLKFGFCYGHQISPTDRMVSIAKENIFPSEIKRIVKSGIAFFNSDEKDITARPEDLFGKDEEILVEDSSSILNNWSNKSLLIKEYRKEEIPNNISQIIQETFHRLKPLYLNLLPIRKKIPEQVEEVFKDFDINQFCDDVSKSDLLFFPKTEKRLVASLLTKPFLILSGLSGSGKTKLAQAFVQWICRNEEQYKIVPVGADWTNREPLLGYANALDQTQYIKPDSGVVDLILHARENDHLPHFLILDEMNLSHVERYFADFLSVMESNGKISFHSGDDDKSGVPASVTMPSNLFIIGTINVDETTYMFSPKVLDRANVIEFKISEKEITEFLENPSKPDLDQLKGEGGDMAQSFMQMAQATVFENPANGELNDTLIKFFSELKKTGAEFGYRSAYEIHRLINQLSVIDPQLKDEEKLDIAIMQKLLPKLHGSRRKLCPVLITLGGFCVQEDLIKDVEKEVFEKEEFDFETDGVKFPLSLEKITRMHKGAVDNGFASYAEA